MKRQKKLRTVEELNAKGFIKPEDSPKIAEIASKYSISLTSHVAELIDANDPTDPIAQQFVPSVNEGTTLKEEILDPIGDKNHSPIKGIVHRYPDRVLLKLLHICPVYCRFCFRREQVGPEGESLNGSDYIAAIDYIRNNKGIWEVILTGGDPLILSPRRLRLVMNDLSAIEHVEVIRFHTRVPIVCPETVTSELVQTLKANKAVFVIVHCNHFKELTSQTKEACARFIDAGIPMLSQTVLLNGINDDPATLEKLTRSLVAMRIKPYYLHQGDLAPGTSHFRTSIHNGQELMRQLRGRVSGLCQPLYVLDIPDGHGKVPIGPSYLNMPDPEGNYLVTDYYGAQHQYPPEPKV